MADPAGAYYHHHHHHHLSSQATHYSSYYDAPPPPPGSSQQPPPPGLHPQYYPPLPPPAPYGAAGYAHSPFQPSDQDEVRTLFIAGLPDDVKSREIYNLFREFSGFESCQVRCTGQSNQAFAFAVFNDQQSALAAMHTLNGMVFDLEKESTLFIDLAKSNSRSKRSRTDDGLPYASDKKIRGAAGYSRGFPESGVGSNIHMPGMGNAAYNGYASTQSRVNFDFEAKGADPNKSQAVLSSSPCPTLFVANLGPTCSEPELTQVFSRCRGFLKLKMQNRNGVPVAFVDFQDLVCSTEALNHLQGTLLYSSDGEGMRLEYAKTRMGLRRRERKS